MIFLSCASDDSLQDDEFVTLAHHYVERYLELNPESATSLGDHRYDGKLDDYSTAGAAERLSFNREALAELESINPDRLSEANAIDYAILRNRIEGAIFRIDVLKEQEWNPLVYNVGGAIYSLIERDFAPLEQRMMNVKLRLEQVPQVAAMAKANVKNPPRVHTETAMLQNKGTISLIRDQIGQLVDSIPELADELRSAQEKAIAALEYYGSWLEKDLLPVSNGEFRLGEEKFRQKLRYVLDSELTMEDILRRAEKDLVDTQDDMFGTALALHRQYFPAEDIDESAVKKETIKRILDTLSAKRPTNESIVDLARVTLTSCLEFTTEKNLVSVPDEPLELIVMPEFQRGVAVAYCDAPGPLEPDAKTFYAISPTPTDWSEDRTESFFREYNNFMLHDLTIHEAVPGHYLQLAH